MFNKLLYLILVACLLSCNLYAFEVESLELSREEVVDMAIESSEESKIKDYDIKKLNQQYREARSTIYPQVNGTLIWGHNSNYPGDEIKDYNANASIGATQVIFSFGKVMAAINGAKNAFNASKYNKEATRRDVVYAANQAYFACALAENVFEIVSSSYENTLENKKILEERSSGGRVSKRDNIKIAADVAARLPQLNTAQAQLNIAINTLKTLIGVTNSSEVKLKDEYLNDYSKLDEAQLYERLMSSEPNLKALKEQIGFADNYIQLKKSEHLPTISAFYDLSKKGSDHSTYVGDDQMDTYSTVGVQVTVPIFSGWKTSSQLEQAKIDKEKIKLEFKKMTEDLVLELDNALFNYNELLKTLEANNNAVHLAMESFKLSQDMFRSGQLSLTDLNDAELQLTNQKLAKQQTLYDLSVTKAKIDHITQGEKLV